MKTSAFITMTLAIGGLAFSGCAVQSEDGVRTRALEQNLSCETMSGIHPMKAALAVAMASEVGRLDPVNDLVIASGKVALTDGAKKECAARGNDGCPNVDAILSMQNSAVNQVIDQTVFNAVAFREDLKASFDRQSNHENNLSMNHKHLLPGEHELFETGISDNGACGVHYDYAAVGEKTENLEERMEFFGGENNPFIDFRSSDSSISIDPTGTMNGDTSTTSGMCTDGCYAYSTALTGSCCTCDGNQGAFRVASWNRRMVYCAY